MYVQHFDLNKRPFLARATGANVFVGPQTVTAIASLKSALTTNDGIACVTGPVGSGKTTLVSRALENFGDDRIVIRISRMRLNSDDVLELLLSEVGAENLPSGTIRKFTAFRSRLCQLEASRTRVFVTVEDPLRLGIETLAELEALTAADAGESDGAGVVLMGDAQLDEFLKQPPLIRVRQRIRLRHEILPMQTPEMRGYLRHCFRNAGGEFESIFEPNAPDLLTELTGGIVRTTNNLIESVMSVSATCKLSKIPTTLIAEVAERDFGLVARDFAFAPVVASPSQANTPEDRVEEQAASAPDQSRSTDLRDDTPETPGQAVTAAAKDETPDPPATPEAPAISAQQAQAVDDAVPAVPSGPVADGDEVTDSMEPERAAATEEDGTADMVFAHEAPPTDRTESAVSRRVAGDLPDLELLAPGLDVTAEPAIPAAETGGNVVSIPELGVEDIAETPVENKKESAEQKSVETQTEEGADIQVPEHTDASAGETLDVAEPQDTESPWVKESEEASAEKHVTTPVEAPAAVADNSTLLDDAASEFSPEMAEVIEALESDDQAEAEAAAKSLEETLAEALPELPIAPELNTPADVPAWDRDPTVAELKPDLDALEKAMAIAKSSTATVQTLTLKEEPEASAKAEAEEAEIPEITLDNAIQRPATISPAAGSPEDTRTNPGKADAELELIAAGLAKAKSLEDVDDKLAETLFGEEFSMIAEQVVATAPAESEHAPETVVAAGEPATPGGGDPDSASVTLQSTPENKDFDPLGASQRLKTVRALNADLHPLLNELSAPAANEPGPPEVPAEPGSIEDQINTSMTQTLKALDVPPPVLSIDDEPEEENAKSGFFKRFRRS